MPPGSWKSVATVLLFSFCSDGFNVGDPGPEMQTLEEAVAGPALQRMEQKGGGGDRGSGEKQDTVTGKVSLSWASPSLKQAGRSVPFIPIGWEVLWG